MAATRFQFNDYTPYYFRTRDSGRTWTRIGAGLPEGGWARVIREDPVRKGLLYAGTELGMHFSLDDGASWQSLQSGLPVTPVYDLKVHGNDLVAATGGRALWILDNVTPLRELNASIVAAPVHLFRPAQAHRQIQGSPRSSDGEGANPARGALLDFHLANAGPVRIEILDAVGSIVRTLVTADARAPGAAVINAKAGMNRVSWDLRQTAIPVLPGAGIFGGGMPQGRWAIPGRYTVRLNAAGTSVTAPLDLRAHPAVQVTAAAYTEQDRFIRLIEKDLVEFRAIAQRIERARTQTDSVARTLTDPAALEAARARAARLTVDTEIYGHLANLHSKVNSVLPGVESSEREMYSLLHSEWLKLKPRLEAMVRDGR